MVHPDGAASPTIHKLSADGGFTLGGVENGLTLKFRTFEINVADSLTCTKTISSISEQENNSGITVSPNPFNSTLNITFENPVNGTIELIDVIGKVVYKSNINSANYMKLHINPSDFSNGIYYLKISGDMNQTIKVIKTNK